MQHACFFRQFIFQKHSRHITSYLIHSQKKRFIQYQGDPKWEWKPIVVLITEMTFQQSLSIILSVYH